jgi:hypothetical protein
VTVPWATFDDGFADHPKNKGLSDAAFRLHVAGILFCNRYLTDGLIKAEEAPDLVRKYRSAALQELIDKGHWLHHDALGLYEIHDFLQWNRSKAEAEAARERKSKAGKKGAASRWHEP